MRLFSYLIIYFFASYLCCGSSSLFAKIELQPFRAYYTISMTRAPSLHSDVSDVRGTLMVEYCKVPGGWTVQQHSEVWKYLSDDRTEHVRWGYVTFESDDQKLFKFRTFTKIDDILQKDIVGVAKREGDRIKVQYRRPESKVVTFSSNVLFPLQHIIAILETAEEGTHMLPCQVFDGSSVDGAYEINTFIGAKKSYNLKASDKSSEQFESHPYWPVRFSVYDIGTTDYEPVYVTTQDMLRNGIFKRYTIDDGIIQLQGILERIELLTPEGE